MIQREIFYSVWLILGFLQFFLALLCRAEFLTKEGHLFSQPLGTYISFQFPNTHFSLIPLRIPRHFFYGNLKGELKFQLPHQQYFHNFSSNISWREAPTSEAPPLPGAQADFRDHKGYAYFDDLGIALCFMVMGDVKSVGINSSEMQWLNMENFINKKLSQSLESTNCSRVVESIQFNRAARKDGQVIIEFTGQSKTPCEVSLTPQQPIQIQVKLISNNPY